ncbi:hypothetical protein FHW68_003672 [Pseudomonas sp. Tn43]|nr:hypothetical protein [Pseudomonas sp. Tn43]
MKMRTNRLLLLHEEKVRIYSWPINYYNFSCLC